MAINNTYTEQFDWFNMSPHHVEEGATERSVKIINDYCRNDFTYEMETQGVPQTSSVGQDNQAYKNWKNINLALGPIANIENPVIVGQCRQNIAAAKDPDGTGTGTDPTSHAGNTSWFQGVNTGPSFVSDGMILMPYTGNQTDQADVKWHKSQTYGHSWFNSPRGGVWEQSQSNVVQFHVEGGLAPNTWMPLFAWSPNQDPACHTWGNGFRWDHETHQSGSSYWEMYANYAVNGSSFNWRSPHHRINALRTCAHEDTVWNQYDVDVSKNYQGTNGNCTQTHRPSGSGNHYGFHKSQNYPVVWWYAHDGAGNAMIISLLQLWNNNHNIAGAGWNGHWGIGGNDDVHGQNPASSGCYIHKPPMDLRDVTSASGIAQLQDWANAQNTRWVYKDSTTLLGSAWNAGSSGADGSYNSYHNGQAYGRTAGHLPEIVHGLTPFGDVDAAALKTPQNFYLHRYGHHESVAGGRPMTSYKFGNLVKTNERNAWYNGHGRGYDYLVQGRSRASDNPHHAPHYWPNLNLMCIAANDIKTGATGQTTGPVKINMVTCGGQTDPVPVVEDRESMFYEFPGTGVSYGAIDKDKKTEIEHKADAWENADALMDPANPNEAICKASGESNAVYIPLVGMTEGNVPNTADKVSTVSITLGGTRKMVLGPQVLKVVLVDKDKTAISPEKVIPGEGSDTLNDDLTVVWPKTSIDCDYGTIKEAKVKIWVHTP